MIQKGKLITEHKVIQFEELEKVSAQTKSSSRIIGLCHGCFDILHAGHVRHFEAAKLLCDVLVVTLTADKHVNKGPTRPIIHQADRSTMLAALEAIDYVSVSNFANAENSITQVKPNIYFKGSDYAEAIENPSTPVYQEKKLVEIFGGRCHLTTEERDSTSNIVNKIKNSS